MTNQRNPDKVPVTFYVPRDLKAKAQAKMPKGETLTNVLTRAMENYAAEEG